MADSIHFSISRDAIILIGYALSCIGVIGFSLFFIFRYYNGLAAEEQFERRSEDLQTMVADDRDLIQPLEDDVQKALEDREKKYKRHVRSRATGVPSIFTAMLSERRKTNEILIEMLSETDKIATDTDKIAMHTDNIAMDTDKIAMDVEAIHNTIKLRTDYLQLMTRSLLVEPRTTIGPGQHD